MEANLNCQCGSELRVEATGDEISAIVGIIRAWHDSHKHP